MSKQKSMNSEINIKTYLDESGNSGKNLVDLKQPFLTLGAVLINDNKLEKFSNFFLQLPAELKNGNEIKGNNIACYNQPIAIKVLSELLPSFSEMFFFSVIEKKFMITGQIVENYFDPAYNENIDNSWTYKTDIKINLANFFYEYLSQETILNVHKAFISCNVEEITSAFYQIIKEIKYVKYDFNIVDLLLGAEKHLQSISDALSITVVKNVIGRKIPKNTLNTPNVTAFFELVGRIEKYLSQRNVYSTLFFDNSEQYNNIFMKILELMNESTRQKVAISEEEHIQFGFNYLNNFKIEKSNESIGLQVADLLASIINNVFAKIIQKKDKDLTTEDIKLTGLVILLTLKQPFGYLTIADSTYKKIKNIFNKFKKMKITNA